MGVGKVTNLVQVQQRASKQFATRQLFGTKINGTYTWITYKEFGDRVDKFRGGLAQLGVEVGDRVAIICDNSVEWAVAAYATYGLGACFVPMYEKQHADDWRYIINDSGAKVLLVADKAIYDVCAEFVGSVGDLERVVRVDGPESEGEASFAGLLALGAKHPVAAKDPASEDMAGFIYTSGTTGNPKGVLLTHGNFASNVNGVQEIFPLRENDRSLSFLPWAHSFGQTCELHCMIASGAAVGLAEDVTTIVQNLPEVQPTLLFAVPRIFNKIYDGLNKRMAQEGGLKKKLFDAAINNANARRALAADGRSSFFVDLKHSIFDKLVFSKVRERFGGKLQFAFSGGAALNKEVALFIDNLNITIYEGYGLSETSPIATANYPGCHRIGSVGKAIPQVKVEVRPVSDIQDPGVGEVVVQGPNVMKGYYNLPEETAKAFTDDEWFRTGDLGRFDEDGFLFIVGRVKEQYKLENGKYVVPAPLEETLQLSPYVNQCMVYGMNKLYNVAVIVPDMAALKEWAEAEGKNAGDVDALLKDPAVVQLFEAQIKEWGASFKGYERPKKFALVKEEFSVENDMLTPKMSLKRRNVVKAYQDVIDGLYA